MARISETEIESHRLEFMLNASRAVFNVCPQLAAYFGNEFLTSCNEDNTTPAILRQSCPSCGVPLVAGRSVSRISVAGSTQSDANGRQNKTHTIVSKSRQRTKPQPTSTNDGRRKVIEIGADGKAILAKTRTNKAVHAATHAGQNNWIKYDCLLCKARIRFPSATKPSREAAGQKRKADNKDLQNNGTTCPKPDHCVSEPLSITPCAPIAPVNTKSSDKSSHTNNSKQQKSEDTRNPAIPLRPSTPMSQSTISSTTTVGSVKQPVTGTQTQAAKRKKPKSNLLAAVAANKKKVEAKKAAESGAFSLTDFLSNL